MKILLLFVVFTCCVVVGILIRKYYRKRKDFFLDFKRFCDDLINDISYKNEKIEIIIKNKIRLYNYDFAQVLNLFLQNILNNFDKDSFEKAVCKILNFLSEEEKKFLLEFFYNIGGLSKEEELIRTNEIKKEIDFLKNEALQKEKKFSNLYFKLFVILGLILIIFFI